MKKVFIPFYLSYKVVFALVFFMVNIITYPFFALFLSRKAWYPMAFKLERFWALLMQLFLLVPNKVERKGDLPEGPFIIVANHTSMVDILMLFRLFKGHFSFMGKAELMKIPLFRIVFRTGMNIAVERGNSRASHEALSTAGTKLDEGISVMIFPEGTISATLPLMRRFKNGAFKLAIEKQVPIVPVTFLNNHRILSEPEQMARPSGPRLSRSIIHESFETKGLTQEDLVSLRDRVYEVIEKPLKDLK